MSTLAPWCVHFRPREAVMAEIAGEAAPPRRVIVAAGVDLEGELALPAGARGIVLLPLGCGVPRLPGDACAARMLREAGLATLLVELLTAQEQNLDARRACFRFDVGMLADRLAAAAGWAAGEAARGLRVCCFAAGNTAAAAFAATAAHPEAFAILVSHQGRLDLADRSLEAVKAPTLLLVDGSDEPLIGINRDGVEQLGASRKELVILEGAAALVEDPAEEAARLAARWFHTHLAPPAATPQPAPGRRSEQGSIG
jgi:hypothetical protein